MRQWIILGMTAAALGGCIPPGRAPVETGGGPVPIEGDSITYETGPCFGACPVYSVTVRPDGSGVFTGMRFTAVSGERRFTLTRAQYDAFAARLAPYRPSAGRVRYAPGEPDCGQATTDMPSVDVTWTRAAGDSRSLYYYFGCDRGKNRGLGEALGSAADALPIAGFIGARP